MNTLSLDPDQVISSALDVRLAELWMELFATPDEERDEELFASFLRAAYAFGYADAVSEAPCFGLVDEVAAAVTRRAVS